MTTHQHDPQHGTAQALLEVFPRLGRMIGRRIRDVSEDDATPGQMEVLMRLKEAKMTTSELAKQRKVSLQSASVLVQSMVERGLLVRMPDPKDRRQSLLEITPAGRERAQAIREQMLEALTELCAGLTPEEVAAAAVFLPGLRRIVSEEITCEAHAEVANREGARTT